MTISINFGYLFLVIIKESHILSFQSALRVELAGDSEVLMPAIQFLIDLCK